MENLAEKTFPLYELLKKDSEFEWTNARELAFSILKNGIVNAINLNHYDEIKKLILVTDASENDIRTILSQKVNGSEKPLSHASSH